MYLIVTLIAIIAIILVYEYLMKQQQKEHRAEVKYILERAEAERQDLYTRLMSKSLPEYQTVKGERPKSTKPRNFLKEQIQKAYGGEG